MTPTQICDRMAQDFFSRQFKRIVKASGVNRGTFKWLRRSSGSYVELEMVGAGTKHLGHKTPTVFTKHYDGKLGGHNLPMPPELEPIAERPAVAAVGGADEFAFL